MTDDEFRPCVEVCRQQLVGFFQVRLRNFWLHRGSYRLCDVDDLMLNTLGGLLGGELVRALEAHLPPIDTFDRIPGSAGALPRLGRANNIETS